MITPFSEWRWRLFEWQKQSCRLAPAPAKLVQQGERESCLPNRSRK